jgi:hypothetical protein
MESRLSKACIPNLRAALVIATVNEFLDIIAVPLASFIYCAESFNKVLEDIFSEISKLDGLLLP